MTVVILPKAKWLAVKVVKSTTAKSSGNSGNKHRKRHDHATGPPGSPRGTCIAIGFKGAKTENPCQCGKHHPNARKENQ